MREHTAEAIAQRQYQQALEALSQPQQAAVRAEKAVALKTNRYDATTATLHLTAAQTKAYRQQIDHWTDYFRDPARNGGLKPDLITDPTELRQFAAFVTWAAWASVAARPGQDYSYTNNFPYDPSVGNVPAPDALLWSALSLIVLLIGIATVLLVFGKFDYLGWVSRGHHVHRHLLPGQSSPGQNALVKFFVVVALLLLTQALMGVFGMLAIALMVFVLRQTSDDVRWAGIEKYIKAAFWGTNVGLAMMVTMSLFPSRVLQIWDVLQHGYWHARSLDYLSSERSRLIEWLRMPGDLVFILFGAVP